MTKWGDVTVTIPEIMVALTVGVTATGAIYALRRQGNSFVISDNSELRQKIVALENNNRYLLEQIQQMRIAHDLQVIEMQKRMDMFSGLLMDVQQESRNLKKQNEEYLAEISGLRSAIKRAT